jgi:nucleoside-diphosphate-sugar epimerase
MGRYLVTGAAGFIASRVCEMLMEEGHQVVGIDNLCDAYDVRLKEYRLNKLKKQALFDFHYLDICDRPALQKLFEEKGPFEAVYNLAARAGVRLSVENPFVFVETNVTGTLNLLEMVRQQPSKKFVLASTSSLYGSHNPVPFSEDADTNRPLSPYAASKKGAEAMCFTYHHLYGVDVTIFRYFTVYGPAGRPDMSLFRFAQWIAEDRPLKLTGDGHQSRDFTYIDDIARGTILGRKMLGYEIINLGNDHPHEMMEVIHIIEARLGKKANILYQPTHPADVFATRANINKAQQILGWRPEVDLETGLNKLVDWYLAERSWTKDVLTP